MMWRRYVSFSFPRFLYSGFDLTTCDLLLCSGDFPVLHICGMSVKVALLYMLLLLFVWLLFSYDSDALACQGLGFKGCDLIDIA